MAAIPIIPVMQPNTNKDLYEYFFTSFGNNNTETKETAQVTMEISEMLVPSNSHAVAIVGIY